MEIELIRPGDPGYERPMEAVHGPTGLNRPEAQGNTPNEKKRKRIWRGRRHPSDGSTAMRGIGDGRRFN